MRTMFVLLPLLCFSAFAADATISCGSSSAATAVSSAEQAILAAKTAWRSVYDKAQWHEVFAPASVAASEPYSAVLTDGVWLVSGKSIAGKASPIAYVCKSDGSVSVASK